MDKTVNLFLFLLLIAACKTPDKLSSIKSNCYDTATAIIKIKEYSIKKLKPKEIVNLEYTIANCDSVKAIDKRIIIQGNTIPNVYFCDTAFYINILNTKNNQELSLIIDCKTCKIKKFPRIQKIK